jgi:fimbrial isopeptide formation D2 family protein/LPXTG-motif cell wall-anchored protein
MSHSILRRLSAAAGVLALSVAATFVAVTPATAVTQPGNIDPSIPRTLTLHKSALGPDSPQLPGTGQELATEPGPPLSGATFTVARVDGVDLLTPAGWTEVQRITPQSAATRLVPGSPATQTTDGAGLATFSGLPVGLYLVTETVLPAGATNRAAPFLVTLPFPTGPNGTPGNRWIYDVHAYPKNAVTALRKERIGPDAGSVEARTPDLVRWEIESDIPRLTAGDAFDTFTLTDTLPTGLDYVETAPNGVAPTSVRVTAANGSAQSFVAGTDYTITYDDATRDVTLAFTRAGLNRLRTLPEGLVDFTVLTRAVTIPANGQLVNTATSVINETTLTQTGSTPIGQLTIYAFTDTNRDGQNRTGLAGAVYQVFLTQDDAIAGRNPITIGVNGQTTFTTVTGGRILVPIVTTGQYFVREITPPAGFQLPVLQNPQPTTVLPGVTTENQNIVLFIHDQVPAFALPLTGGDGALWFTVGGIGLISIALGTGIVASRRRATAALADA